MAIISIVTSALSKYNFYFIVSIFCTCDKHSFALIVYWLKISRISLKFNSFARHCNAIAEFIDPFFYQRGSKMNDWWSGDDQKTDDFKQINMEKSLGNLIAVIKVKVGRLTSACQWHLHVSKQHKCRTGRKTVKKNSRQSRPWYREHFLIGY